MPRGGMSFEEFCASGGTDNYTFNVVDLKKETFKGRVDLLIKQIKKTIGILEQSGRKIEEFCVGKTFVKKLKKGPKFDPAKENTWKVAEGVGDRWRNKYKPEEYNGLVVVGAVSSDMLKDKARSDGVKCNTDDWNHQSYALALESALICHYAFQDFDHRLANRSLSPGNLQNRLSAGYVIYFAFKYEENEEVTEEEDSSGQEENTEKDEGTKEEDSAGQEENTEKDEGTEEEDSSGQEENTKEEEGTEREKSKKSKQEGGCKKKK